MSPFEIYWRTLGLPLSRAKGFLVDAVPFSVVEFAVWTGITATLLFILGSFPAMRRTRLWEARRLWFFFGPIFLLLLGAGQGAFPFSLAPTAWRQPLHDKFLGDSLSYSDFQAQVDLRAQRLNQELSPSDYYSLSELEVLTACDTALDSVLDGLGLPGGRRVTALKTMGPLSTLMGLVYGGPAFHDPFFGELAVVDSSDLPTSHFWRLLAACHETAHAKGFTREMDAEILTYLALRHVPDPRYALIADIQFLRKSGEEIQWPALLKEEADRVRETRRKVEMTQPVAQFMQRWATRLKLRNDEAKYGQRDRADEWNPIHPFFSTVLAVENEQADNLE